MQLRERVTEDMKAAMKAREAPVMFPGFGDKDQSVQEIASKATGDLSHYRPAASPNTIMEGAHIE